MLSRFLVGGLLAWAAVSVAFGPELVRGFVRMRSARAYADTQVSEGTRTSPAVLD